VRWFWEVVGEMGQEDRARLLQFVTGTSKVRNCYLARCLGKRKKYLNQRKEKVTTYCIWYLSGSQHVKRKEEERRESTKKCTSMPLHMYLLIYPCYPSQTQVPLEGFKSLQGVAGPQKFQIQKAYGGTDKLPQAHTCFNQVRYLSREHNVSLLHISTWV
jgi:hypothetical protein